VCQRMLHLERAPSTASQPEKATSTGNSTPWGFVKTKSTVILPLMKGRGYRAEGGEEGSACAVADTPESEAVDVELGVGDTDQDGS